MGPIGQADPMNTTCPENVQTYVRASTGLSQSSLIILYNGVIANERFPASEAISPDLDPV